MSLLAIFTFIILVATPQFASAQSRAYRPGAPNLMSIGVFGANDTRADEGVGLAFNYEVPIVDAGISRLVLGPRLHAVFASEEYRSGGCRFNDDEQILMLGASMRWILDAHPIMRPWFNVGLGMFMTDFERDQVSPCVPLEIIDDNDVGLGMFVGAGLEFQLEPRTVINFELGAYNAETDDDDGIEDEDYITVGLALGWRM